MRRAIAARCWGRSLLLIDGDLAGFEQAFTRFAAGERLEPLRGP